MADLPLLIEADFLEKTFGSKDFLIIDLSKAETYAKLHVPGAVHLDYAQIVAAKPPVMGLLPDDAALQNILSALGCTRDTHIVVYDDEGGGRAARLLWTLEIAGHPHHSLLNGGLHAYANEGHPCDNTAVTPTPATFVVAHNDTPLATREYILQRLHSPDTALLDVRSPDEYHGIRKYAERAGHIPGAVNLEWTRAMNPQRNLRFQPDDELRRMLTAIGITPEREVITYCQTHHRSAHTYLVLKHLGYPAVKGYAGSWSDWGNRPDVPIEV